MAILSTVKVSAEPAINPRVINVQMKAGQIVELERGRPFILKFPKEFAGQIVDVKASVYPVKIPRADIPKDAPIPNYFSCAGHQVANDPDDQHIPIANESPTSDMGVNFIWQQIDKDSQLKTKLVNSSNRPSFENDLSEFNVLYLTIAPQKGSKKIVYDLYESMRMNEIGMQVGWRSDVHIRTGTVRQNDLSCTVPKFLIMLKLVDNK